MLFAPSYSMDSANNVIVVINSPAEGRNYFTVICNAVPKEIIVAENVLIENDMQKRNINFILLNSIVASICNDGTVYEEENFVYCKKVSFQISEWADIMLNGKTIKASQLTAEDLSSINNTATSSKKMEK
jgi:hypothetical protein